MTTAELVERLRNATPVDHDNCPELSAIAADWIEAADRAIAVTTSMERMPGCPCSSCKDRDKFTAVRSRLEAMK